MDTIGKRLRKLRRDHKLSGDKFGEMCGVSKGMVSQWENDEVTIPIDRLLRLRENLDFSFDYILTGKTSIASEIEQQLGESEKRAWFRAGYALAEPAEGTNGKK